MATHSSALTWEMPWTEEPGRLQSMRSQELDTTTITTIPEKTLMLGKIKVGREGDNRG